MNEIVVFLLQLNVIVLAILAITLVPYLLFTIFDDVVFGGRLVKHIRNVFSVK